MLAKMPSMSPLRTALLGCGRFARRHAAILAGLEAVELVGFCDSVLENAANYNATYARGQAAVYTDYARMFAELPLDLAYICLPPYAHDCEVELACRHGVHFLIEKPIALSLPLAERMAAAVRASGVKTQVGFMYRHGHAVQRLRQSLDADSSARGAFLTLSYACNSLHSAWWRDREKSGGQLVEQAIHLLDLTRFFLGEPVEVFAVQANLFHRHVPDYTVEDASATVVRFRSGGLAVLTANNGAIPGRWEAGWRLVTPGLTADFSHANSAVFHDTRADRPEGWPPAETVTAETDLYLAETLDLLAAIRDDRPATVPIEEGVRTLALALAARRSAEENRPISLVE
jgi:predicted dehydrogenase